MAKKTDTKTKPAKAKPAKPAKAKAAKAKAATGNQETKTATVQTIYQALLNGHANHFGKYEERNKLREFIPASVDELKDIALEYLRENDTAINPADLDEPQHLCHVLELQRKATR